MQRRTRHVIAVMVVATALCADRGAAAVASSHARPERTPSKGLASRLTSGFKRTVGTRVTMLSARTAEAVRSFPLPIREEASGVRAVLSPFQFRLPPPSR